MNEQAHQSSDKLPDVSIMKEEEEEEEDIASLMAEYSGKARSSKLAQTLAQLEEKFDSYMHDVDVSRARFHELVEEDTAFLMRAKSKRMYLVAQDQESGHSLHPPPRQESSETIVPEDGGETSVKLMDSELVRQASNETISSSSTSCTSSFHDQEGKMTDQEMAKDIDEEEVESASQFQVRMAEKTRRRREAREMARKSEAEYLARVARWEVFDDLACNS